KYVVINRANMGGDSARAVANIEDDMQRYRPHLVLAMIGMKDQGGPATGQEPSRFGLRTFRFIKLLLQDLNERQTAESLNLGTQDVRIPASFFSQIDREFHFLNAYSPAERLSDEEFKQFKSAGTTVLYRL